MLLALRLRRLGFPRYTPPAGSLTASAKRPAVVRVGRLRRTPCRRARRPPLSPRHGLLLLLKPPAALPPPWVTSPPARLPSLNNKVVHNSSLLSSTPLPSSPDIHYANVSLKRRQKCRTTNIGRGSMYLVNLINFSLSIAAKREQSVLFRTQEMDRLLCS